MLGNQTGPQLLDAHELLSLWLFYPFFFVCGTKRKLLVLPIFEFQTPVLMITFFICGLEAATKKRAQTLNMLKLSTAIQVLEGQIQYI